jgi:hypothetical protein
MLVGSIEIRQLPVCRASRRDYSMGQFLKPALSAGGSFTLLFSTHEISSHKHMSWRIVFPVGHKIIQFPESELLDFSKSPSGSGGDMTENKRPVRYTGTGVGSPAAAFLSPDTSSIALNSALKSSKVRPFSSCSAVRS